MIIILYYIILYSNLLYYILIYYIILYFYLLYYIILHFIFYILKFISNIHVDVLARWIIPPNPQNNWGIRLLREGAKNNMMLQDTRRWQFYVFCFVLVFGGCSYPVALCEHKSHLLPSVHGLFRMAEVCQRRMKFEYKGEYLDDNIIIYSSEMSSFYYYLDIFNDILWLCNTGELGVTIFL
jgi:hypothetical protein